MVPLRAVFVIVVSLLFTALAHGQATISLRSSARLPEDAQQVRLADIADLDGDALGLGQTVVLDQVPSQARGSWVKIDLTAVRAALDARAGGVNWGRVSLRGAACTVRFSDPKLALSKASDSANTPSGAPQAIDTSGPATIRTAIATRLASLYGVEIDRLRLGFDPADADILNLALDAKQIDVAPAGLASSSRLPVNLTVYDGEAINLTRTIQVSALVYRPVLVAAATIERGRTIGEDQVNAVEQWLPPGGKAPSTLTQIIGSTAQNRITAGQTIDADDVVAPIACKRGDTVYIHCLSGSFVVKVRCRAMGTARDGELVQLKPENSDESVTARMSGKGRAVLIAKADQPDELCIVREREPGTGDSAPPTPPASSGKPPNQRPLRKGASR